MRNYGERKPNGTTQAVDVTSTSTAVTNPFGAQTYAVRIQALAALHYHIFDAAQGNSTCTSNDPALGAQTYVYVPVSAGQKVSLIAATAAYGFSSTPASVNARCTVEELT